MQLSLCFCNKSATQYPFLNKGTEVLSKVEALNKVDCCQLHTKSFMSVIKYIRNAYTDL